MKQRFIKYSILFVLFYSNCFAMVKSNLSFDHMEDTQLAMSFTQNMWKEINTKLLVASLKGNLKEVIDLVDNQGANVNTVDDEDQWTALHFAVKYYLKYKSKCALISQNHFDVVKYLVEHDADINATDKYGRTPLFIASNDKHNLDLVKYLVEHNAEVNAIDKYGKTPLLKASACGCTNIAQYLISKGAKTNVTDNHGLTPLHFAVSLEDNLTLVRHLVNNNAPINIPDDNGQTPIHIASALGNHTIANFLMNSCANIQYYELPEFSNNNENNEFELLFFH